MHQERMKEKWELHVYKKIRVFYLICFLLTRNWDQFSLIAQSCQILCDPMDCSMPGFPVLQQLFTSGGQSTGVSASASVLPMNIQDWFPLRLTGQISLHSRDSQKSSPTPQFKSINSQCSAFFIVCTILFSFCKKSWTIFYNRSTWWNI